MKKTLSLLFVVFGIISTQAQEDTQPKKRVFGTPQEADLYRIEAAYDPIHSPPSFEAMYDAVMVGHHMLQVDPQSVAYLKPLFARQESRYWSGSSAGIEEKDIVTLVNTFVGRQKLPDTAKTTLSQIHLLRMERIKSADPFAVKGADVRTENGALAFNTRMSDLQAFELVETLIDHKLLFPRFLQTPDDWEESLKHPVPPSTQDWITIEGDRLALEQKLRRAFYLMSMSEAASMISNLMGK
jgi:hypothetical protein